MLLDAKSCLFELICEFNLICSYNFGLLIFLHNINLICPKSLQTLILISWMNFINQLRPNLIMHLLFLILNSHKLFIQDNFSLGGFYSWYYINFLTYFCLIILDDKFDIFFIKNQPLFFNSLFIILWRPGTWINFDNFRITITRNNWHRIRCVNKPVFDFKQILFQRRHWSWLLYFNLFCFCIVYNS